MRPFQLENWSDSLAEPKDRHLSIPERIIRLPETSPGQANIITGNR